MDSIALANPRNPRPNRRVNVSQGRALEVLVDYVSLKACKEMVAGLRVLEEKLRFAREKRS